MAPPRGIQRGQGRRLARCLALSSKRAARSAALGAASAPILLAVSIAAAVAYLLLGAALMHTHGPDGLYERIFLGLELLWIALAALAITLSDWEGQRYK